MGCGGHGAPQEGAHSERGDTRVYFLQNKINYYPPPPPPQPSDPEDGVTQRMGSPGRPPGHGNGSGAFPAPPGSPSGSSDGVGGSGWPGGAVPGCPPHQPLLAGRPGPRVTVVLQQEPIQRPLVVDVSPCHQQVPGAHPERGAPAGVGDPHVLPGHQREVVTIGRCHLHLIARLLPHHVLRQDPALEDLVYGGGMWGTLSWACPPGVPAPCPRHSPKSLWQKWRMRWERPLGRWHLPQRPAGTKLPWFSREGDTDPQRPCSSGRGHWGSVPH